MKKRKIWVVLLFLILNLHISANALEEEYVVKSVFLNHFADYIDWPEESGVTDRSKPFVIAVIGSNPFGSSLDQVYKKVRIKNKKVTVRFIKDVKEIGESQCNLLFIPKTGKKKLSEIILFTKDRPILTVGDSKGYAGSGIHINFFQTKENNLGFDINQRAMKEAGLNVSVRLLELARDVIEE